MPINTGGFQVQVMPQFTPVDPGLVAFNPQAFQQGQLASLNINRADTQNQLLNLMLDTQRATHEAEKQDILAKLGALKDTYAPSAAATISNANTQVAENAAKAPFLATDAQSRSDILGQGAVQAKLKTGAEQRQAAVDEAGQEGRLAVASAMGTWNKESAQKQVDLAKANLDATLAKAEAEPDNIQLQQAADSAKIGFTLANTNYLKQEGEAKMIQAKALADRSNAMISKINSQAETVKLLQKQRDSDALEASRLGNTVVPDPLNPMVPVKLSEWYDKAYTTDKDGNQVPREKGLPFIKSVANASPETKAAYEQYITLRRSSIESAKQAKYLTDQMVRDHEELRKLRDADSGDSKATSRPSDDKGGSDTTPDQEKPVKAAKTPESASIDDKIDKLRALAKAGNKTAKAYLEQRGITP